MSDDTPLSTLVAAVRATDVHRIERSVHSSRANTRGRFLQRMEAYGTVIDALLEVRSAELSEPLLDALRASQVPDALACTLDDGLSYIGHECIHFYGGQPWEELCRLRSALGFLAELVAPHADLLEPLDLEWADDVLCTYGIELFEAVSVPPGMPSDHWWWHHESPPVDAVPSSDASDPRGGAS